LITVHPEHVSPTALAFVDVVIATGESAGATLSAFANTTQIALPSDLPTVPETGEALVWFARKTELLLMGLRFKVFQRDRSMVLVTEGLGSQPFHGRTVLLINEHSHSAAEMVASFAKQNRLATLAGTKTAGEVLGGANFKLRSGYVLTRA
jgi:hypothetical protein